MPEVEERNSKNIDPEWMVYVGYEGTVTICPRSSFISSNKAQAFTAAEARRRANEMLHIADVIEDTLTTITSRPQTPEERDSLMIYQHRPDTGVVTETDDDDDDDVPVEKTATMIRRFSLFGIINSIVLPSGAQIMGVTNEGGILMLYARVPYPESKVYERCAVRLVVDEGALIEPGETYVGSAQAFNAASTYHVFISPPEGNV